MSALSDTYWIVENPRYLSKLEEERLIEKEVIENTKVKFWFFNSNKVHDMKERGKKNEEFFSDQSVFVDEETPKMNLKI